MHNHQCGCDHELKYCGHCDVCYCKKCGKEWKQYNYNWYTYPNWTYCSNTGNATLSTTSSGNSTVTCNHMAV